MNTKATFELKVTGADNMFFSDILSCVILIKGWDYGKVKQMKESIPVITKAPVYACLLPLMSYGALKGTPFYNSLTEVIDCMEKYTREVKNGALKDIIISDLKFNKQSHALTFHLKVPEEIKETFLSPFWQLFISSLIIPS